MCVKSFKLVKNGIFQEESKLSASKKQTNNLFIFSSMYDFWVIRLSINVFPSP